MRRRLNVTDYGSGIYPGPTTSAIQDAGWADPDLKWGMLGDSITYRAAPKLRAAFAQAGVDSFAIRAHSGQNWAGSNNWLDSLTYLPENLIVFLGSNDVQNPFGVPEQIARTKAIIGSTNLFLVDTYVNRPAYPNHDLRNSGQVNGYIRQAVDEAHTVDWVAALTSAVGRGRPISYYIQDGVHPWVAEEDGHGDGTAFLAAVVMATVQPFILQ
jgi:hypothetical protein